MNNKSLVSTSTGLKSKSISKVKNRKKRWDLIPPPPTKMLVDMVEKERLVLITGSGGVGKSHITKFIRRHFKNVVALAPTNSSTEHIKGVTYQSLFKFQTVSNPKELRNLDRYNIKEKQKKHNISYSQAEQWYFQESKDRILNADLILLDEISLLNSIKFDMIIDRITYFLKDKPFPPILLIGDLYQIPPVDPQNKSKKIRYIFESKNWKCKIVELATIKRTTDKDFIEILQMFRKGIRDPRLFAWAKEHKYDENNKPIGAMNLCARKDTTSEICSDGLEAIDGKPRIYRVKPIPLRNKKGYKTKPKQVDDYIKKEFAGKLKLELKVGASVMFCATVKGQYINGEMGLVLEMSSNEIIVEKIDGKGRPNGKVIVTPFRFTKKDYKSSTPEDIIEINQFPLILSYAVTMHKIQGATITCPIIVHCDDIWEEAEGLLYTSVSRATSPDNVYLKGFKESMIQPRPIIDEFFKQQHKDHNIEIITDY